MVQEEVLVFMVKVGRALRQLLLRLLLLASIGIGRPAEAMTPTPPPTAPPPRLVYSTYYGSTDPTERHSTGAAALALTTAGQATITGKTSSQHLPLQNAYDRSHSGSLWDGFIAQLDPTGAALAYATYFGSGSETIAEDIAIDPLGNIYLTGSVYSGFQPYHSSIQAAVRGDADVFIAKFSPNGTTLLYAAVLGGSDYDSGYRVATDPAGNAYLTGETRSADFPTVSPLQARFGGPGRGDGDAFVAKIAADGSRVLYATYLGGSSADSGFGLAVDAAGAAYVTGFTASGDFPLAQPFRAQSSQAGDAFVAKLRPDGTALDYATYLGSGSGAALTVDAGGQTTIVGTTASPDFPLVHPVQAVFNAGVATTRVAEDLRDAFVAQLAPDGQRLTFATYLGGSGRERGVGIGQDPAGNLYIGGETNSVDFPLVRPLQDHYGGDNIGITTDAFIVKLAPGGAGVQYATYFGGVGWEELTDLAVDMAGNVYLAGDVEAPSPDFPLTGRSFQTANTGIRSAFVAKLADDSPAAPQAFPTATLTPADTGPSRPPPGYERHWLDKIPCALPCWEGITLGQTTLTETMRLLEQNAGIQPTSIIVRPTGQPEDHQGYIQWRWRGSDDGGQILYDAAQGPAIVTDIWPGLESIPGAQTGFTLGQVIAAYGEPSHIHATGFYGLHGDGPFYTASFIYAEPGITLEATSLYEGKPRLGPDLPLGHVTFSTRALLPLRPTFAGRSDDPSTGPQPWQGYQDFMVYCRNTSLGAAPGAPCPEERLVSGSGEVLVWGVLLGGLVILSLIVSRVRRLRRAG
jgi:hypothetical protein